MCGIAGFADSSTASPLTPDDATTRVREMCSVIRHRGPDDEGVWVDEGVALGMRRLSIIDLAGGHQPIHNEDRTVWIVFNGEIYNFRSAARRTGGRRPPLLHVHGHRSDCSRLRGMGHRRDPPARGACSVWPSGMSRTRMLLARAGPRRDQTAALRHRRRTPALRVGAEVASLRARPGPRDRRRRTGSLPLVPVHPARFVDLPRRLQAAAGSPAHLAGRAAARAAVLASVHRRIVRRDRSRRRGGARAACCRMLSASHLSAMCRLARSCRAASTHRSSSRSWRGNRAGP